MKIDPAKHSWMVAPETRKLMAAPRRGIWLGVKYCEKCPLISRDKTNNSECRDAD
jgi:hypothetical protein